MPVVRVGREVYSKLKVLHAVLKKLGKAETLGDVIDYLISLSPLNDILGAKTAKELALIYAQLAGKSWNKLNEELTKACGSSIDSNDETALKCIEGYLKGKLGLDEAEELIKTKP